VTTSGDTYPAPVISRASEPDELLSAAPDEPRPAHERREQNENNDLSDPDGRREPGGLSEAIERPVDLPDPPQTGDPDVDMAIAAVAQAVVGGSLEEQLVAYDAAHRTLQDRLADVEG
jgi:hypothetical protein